MGPCSFVEESCCGSSGRPELLRRSFLPLPNPPLSGGFAHWLNRNESAYGPCERAKVAFEKAFTEVNRYPSKEAANLRAG